MIFRNLLSQAVDFCREKAGEGITQVGQNSQESLLVGIGDNPVYRFQDMRVGNNTSRAIRNRPQIKEAACSGCVMLLSR